MNIWQPADAVSVIDDLHSTLDVLHDSIARGAVELESAEGTLLRCNNEYIELVKFSRTLRLKRGSTEREKEFQQQLDAVNKGLQAVRETLGRLIEVLRIRENSAGSGRLPTDFWERHSAAESTIEETLVAIEVFLRENSGPAGSQEPSYGGSGGSSPVSDLDDERQYRKIYTDWKKFG